MTDEQIFTRLKEILSQTFELPEQNIHMDSHLFEDLDLDSIDAVDLALKLQEMTGKRIKPDEFKTVRTVRDVVSAVRNLLAAAA
jgi:acyl carrier protein